ncbi:hypothetical protein LTS18_003414 [Coniosporium uncinatum]|uniref:Uncharacterized protein n=1 Tax=Coniosporium uncinatum TaxID=93489 RepID=A0ACC3DBH3_9PEZI|nr:hypothetical protein LTS18_003414 [Coniosporium uncinatum]
MINPDAGNFGGKTGFIFTGTGLITAVIGFFLFPETTVSRNNLPKPRLRILTKQFRGIPFEKLDELYADRLPPCKFRQAFLDNPNVTRPEADMAARGSKVTEILEHRHAEKRANNDSY